MGRTEPRQLTWSEAQGSRTMIDQDIDILQQMSMLRMTARNLSSQVHEEFESERSSRHQDFAKMEQKMSDRMAEGFRCEQQARQLAQNEIMKGLHNEEHARQMVQKDLAVLKVEKKKHAVGQALGWVWVPRAPLRGSQRWPSDTTRFSFQGRWNSKAGSLIIQDAVFRDLWSMRL